MSNPIPAPFWGAWQLMVRNPFWTCLGPLKPNGFEHDFFFPLKKSEIKNGVYHDHPLDLGLYRIDNTNQRGRNISPKSTDFGC